MDFNKKIEIPNINLNIPIANATTPLNPIKEIPIKEIRLPDINLNMSDSKNLKKAREQIARRYYLSGLSLSEIAEKLSIEIGEKVNKSTVCRWAKKYEWDKDKQEIEKGAVLEVLEARREHKEQIKKEVKEKELDEYSVRLISDKIKERYDTALNLHDAFTKAIYDTLFKIDPKTQQPCINPELKPNQVLSCASIFLPRINETLLKLEQNIQIEEEKYGDSYSDTTTWADDITNKL